MCTNEGELLHNHPCLSCIGTNNDKSWKDEGRKAGLSMDFSRSISNIKTQLGLKSGKCGAGNGKRIDFAQRQSHWAKNLKNFHLSHWMKLRQIPRFKLTILVYHAHYLFIKLLFIWYIMMSYIVVSAIFIGFYMWAWALNFEWLSKWMFVGNQVKSWHCEFKNVSQFHELGI